VSAGLSAVRTKPNATADATRSTGECIASVMIARASPASMSRSTPRSSSATVSRRRARRAAYGLSAGVASTGTYAADFGVDEARAVGAEHVNFTKPVIGYMENFRGAPVGARVPNGYYERSTQQWVPDSDGRVVKVLSESDGIAALDVTGDGQPASAQTLTTLGIDDAELAKVAALYEPGQELWRVPTKHFSDWNYGPRIVGAALPAAAAWIKQTISDPCHATGSVIECENQTLGEDLALTGTGVGLHYRSDRVPGRSADRSTIDIPLTGASVPSGLLGVELRVDVAGRRFAWRATHAFAAEPNTSHRFVWDGKDAFGRTLQGAQRARISVGYVYATRYRSDAPSVDDTSRGFGVPPSGTAVEFSGLGGAGAAGTAWWQRPHITVWQPNDTTLGGFDARAAGLGGWTLTPHHQYDPVSRTLYRGDGSREAAQTVDRVINRFAGNGSSDPASTSGQQATQQSLHGPQGMAVGADGSVYIADFYNDVIRRVRPDGTITIAAGRQRPSFYQPRIQR
jgi:hypothetical protein